VASRGWEVVVAKIDASVGTEDAVNCWMDFRLVFAYTVSAMAPREITPAQAFGIIAQRIEKRIQVLKGVKLDGYSVAMSELDIVLRYVRNAQQYFVSTYRETTGGPHR
jgi:hypothetical protein